MPRPKKEVLEVIEIADNTADVNYLRALFTASALSGLIARGSGQSPDSLCQAAINYANAMMEKYK